MDQCIEDELLQRPNRLADDEPMPPPRAEPFQESFEPSDSFGSSSFQGFVRTPTPTPTALSTPRSSHSVGSAPSTLRSVSDVNTERIEQLEMQLAEKNKDSCINQYFT